MIIFLDIEASGLYAGSYPIEIGWVDETGAGESHLIRPAPDWTSWSQASETIHGISREMLAREGRDHDWVARRVAEALAEADAVYTDAPEWDQAWLDRLTDAAGLPPACQLADFTEAVGFACRPLLAGLPRMGDPTREAELASARALCLRIAADAAEAEARRKRARHRAEDDARGLWWRWRQVQAEVGRLV
jgi:hypothetical protein